MANLTQKVTNFISWAKPLFSEGTLGMLRLICIVLVALAFAAWGVWKFETVADPEMFFYQVFRYMIAPLSSFIFVYLLAAHYVQDIYKLDNYLDAIQYLAALLFGWFSAGLKVKDGKAEPGEKSESILTRIGGPGYLDIEMGNVVVLERLESPSRILGAGHHFVSRFERIKNIISLMDQIEKSDTPIIATTKDGIPVKIHNLQMRFRVHAGYKSGEPKRTLRNPYPYSIKTVREITYNVNAGEDGNTRPWSKAAFRTVTGIVTGFINSNLLDRVIYPRVEENDSRNEIVKKIESNENKKKLKAQGVDLLWYDLGQFEVADDIEERRKDARFANLWGAASVVRAQGEAERIANHERGLAEGQINLLSGIIQALNDVKLSENVDENLWNIVLARSAQIIESMTTIYRSVEESREVRNGNKDEHRSMG